MGRVRMLGILLSGRSIQWKWRKWIAIEQCFDGCCIGNIWCLDVIYCVDNLFLIFVVFVVTDFVQFAWLKCVLSCDQFLYSLIFVYFFHLNTVLVIFKNVFDF